MLIAVTALKIVTNTADAVVYYASGSGVQNRIFHLGAGFTGRIFLVTSNRWSQCTADKFICF